MPLLDTTQLERVKSGKREESYWPVGVADGKFYCFILKGGDLNPSIYPRPLLTDFAFNMPVASTLSDEGDEKQAKDWEEEWLRNSVLESLHRDLVETSKATRAQREELAKMGMEMDLLVLKQLGVVCAGRREEQGARALELAGLLRDVQGGMVEKAGLIAGRFGMEVLRGKIEEVAEARSLGMDGEA